MARHHKSKRHHKMHDAHERSEKRHVAAAEKHLKSMQGMHKKYDTLRHEKEAHNDERHHDSMSEGSGSYHYDRQEPGAGKYEGYKGRRHQEMRDAGMIHEDRSQIANLPQGVMIKPYGDTYGYTPEDLDDTIRGIDRQIGFDDSQKMRHFFPKKV